MASPTVDRRFGLVGNAALKAPVTVVATINIALSGQQTIDGVAVLASNASGIPDRVLVTGQADATQNGIYDVSLNAWSRSADADGPYDFTTGTQVLVASGTVNVRTVWCLTTALPITIGTTALTWQLAVGASLGSFVQTGVAAVSRTFTSKDRDHVSIFDFLPQSEIPAIQAGTSVFDCFAAITAAIASATYFSGIHITAPAVYFPPGQYHCSAAIQLKKTVRLYGDGGGMSSGPSVNIIFNAGSSGIVVHQFNTINNAVEVPTTTSGSGSIIEGLQLVGAYSAAPDVMGGHGVWFRAAGILKNCLVSGFTGDGVRVIATVGGGGAVEGNANGTQLQMVTSQLNGEWGLQVAGGDANACTFIGVQTSTNGTGGIFDNSFLGNTYVQPQVAIDGAGNAGQNVTRGRTGMVWLAGQRYYAVYPATDAQLVATVPGTDSTIWGVGAASGAADATHPLWLAAQPVGTYFSASSYRFTNVNSRGLVLNPYEESGYSVTFTTGPTLILGGLLTGYLGNSRLLGATIGPSTPGKFTAATLGFTAGVSFNDTSGGFAWDFKSPATGRYSIHWANIEKDFHTRYDRNATVANGYARTIDATAPGGNTGSLGFAAQYYRGAQNVMKWRGLQAAAPTVTVSLQGDSFEFLAPTAGGFIGQVCTVAGTPGTWRNYGEIGGNGAAVVQGAGGAKTVAVAGNVRHIEITTNNANLPANSVVLFTWTSSTIGANDIVLVTRKSGGTAGSYNVWCDSVAAGSCVIAVQNITAGALAEVLLLQAKVVSSFVAA
jgi:hypothetical protein